MAQFFYLQIPQWNKGSTVLAGGTVNFFVASSSTPQNVFSDSTGGTSLGPVVTLDANGQAQIWLAAAAYKIILKDSAGVTVLTVDNFNPTNVNTTVASLTDIGDLTMQQSTAATSGANQSSKTLKIQGNYWNGSASAVDEWDIQDVLGSGTNPTSSLTISHSGSSGAAKVSIPGDLLIGGNETNTGTITAPAFISNNSNAASAGQLRLATGDAIKYRNVANGGDVQLTDAGAAAASTGNLADNLKWSGGGAQFAAYVDQSAAPAQSGVLRTGNTTTAVAARNAAGGADLALLGSDSSNNAQITPPIRQVEQAAPTGIASSDLLWADSTDHRWKMKNNNGTAKLVAGGTPASQIFTSNGTFTIPAGVTGVKVTIVGGGGAGGGSTAANNGGGGGSGGIAVKFLSGITPANTIAVTVGAGGTGVSASAGNNGSASSIASGTETITTVTANGGNGGASSGTASAGGNGAAVSTNGDINGAGSPGANSSTGNLGGWGGATFLGGPGGTAAGAAGNNAVANTGSGGGGGGAAGNAAGGNGAAGIVIFEWGT